MARAATPRLIVLGSGTSVPSARRATSCYLVDPGDGRALLVDLGPGALHRAAAAGYDLDHLAAILITHVHPDHTADLVALQFALMNPIPRRGMDALPVRGAPEVLLLVARLRNAWPRWLAAGPERLDLAAIAPGPVPLPGQDFDVRAFTVAHHASSLGYRLTLPDGCVVAFSGDATEGADLVALGRDADLFVLEAAASESCDLPGHLTARRAGRVAAEAGARSVLLTHFYPPADEEPAEDHCREAFAGEILLAQDGTVVDLRPRGRP